MLSRVSRGGPTGTGTCSVVPNLGCSNVNLDDPGTGEASNRSSRELSALLPPSVSTANWDKLRSEADGNLDFFPDHKSLLLSNIYYLFNGKRLINKHHKWLYLPVVVSARPSGTAAVAPSWTTAGGTVEVVSALAMVTSLALLASSPQWGQKLCPFSTEAQARWKRWEMLMSGWHSMKVPYAPQKNKTKQDRKGLFSVLKITENEMKEKIVLKATVPRLFLECSILEIKLFIKDLILCSVACWKQGKLWHSQSKNDNFVVSLYQRLGLSAFFENSFSAHKW